MRNLGLSKKICLVIILFYSFFPHSNAQNEVNIDLGANFVSSYVWRGIKQTGFSVQPSLGANYRGLHLSSWASTDISNGNDRGFKEVDFTLGYSKNGFNIALTDYWWDGEGAHRYFSGAREDYSGHMLEGTIGYTLPERFPLSINWNTFFLGKGNKKEDGSNSYSTYIELAYPFSVNDIDMGLALGFTPWRSVVYGPDANGLKVTNIMLSASHSIKFSDSFSIPIYGNIIFNPATEDTHFVFGITLSK